MVRTSFSALYLVDLLGKTVHELWIDYHGRKIEQPR
ncbi:hypothetical protein NC651_022523 [Populus alba x Populus x berolinensis]|nr:hypothetical protein NC651_022519 [Populus alba x Populus x berolinensis]KAJ6896337.1 hypothetical protein NC651_022523 [Populus alba x Populus x berolinensis]